MGKPKPETLWFITGRYGIYCGGGWCTRRDAIEDHVRSIGHDWPTLRKQGDRAIKCTVTPKEPK